MVECWPSIHKVLGLIPSRGLGGIDVVIADSLVRHGIIAYASLEWPRQEHGLPFCFRKSQTSQRPCSVTVGSDHYARGQYGSGCPVPQCTGTWCRFACSLCFAEFQTVNIYLSFRVK